MKRPGPDQLIFFSLALFAFSVIFSVTAVEAALLITLALFLFKKHRERTFADLRPGLAGHPLFIPWMVYLGVCLLTSLTAYYPLKGLGQLNSDLIKYVCLSTLLLTVKKEHLPGLSLLYAAAAVLAALVGIAEVAHAVAGGDTGMVRANAFMNAVRYGEVMSIALILILSRLILPPAGTARNERLLYLLSALAVFTAIILSQTRGSYLGLAAGVLVMIWFAGPSRKKLAGYAVIMLFTAAAIMLANPVMRGRMLAMLGKGSADTSENSPAMGVSIRKGLWKLGAKMLKAHPVVGVGPDNVKKVFTRFQPEQIGYEKTWGSLHSQIGRAHV